MIDQSSIVSDTSTFTPGASRLVLYSEKNSPRLSYISTFIFKELLGIGISFMHDRESFINFPGPKVNYSREDFEPNAFWIRNVDLLYQEDIREKDLFITGDKEEFKLFCIGDSPDNKFDLFAASFYLLARYEEYLPHKKDMYGRYAHYNSLSFKHSFLNLPIINIWIDEFAEKLLVRFPDLKFQKPTFCFTPTYDIDIAFAYRGKGMMRNSGGLFKSILIGNGKDAARRIKVLKGFEPDPFDVYDQLDALHAKERLQPIYFFLIAETNSLYDKNILPSTFLLQKLIKITASKYPVALHPSWQSGDDEAMLLSEKKQLEKIISLPVTASRQHYIRFNLPGDFRTLIEAGIEDDYSMGYGSINGFRASVATTHHWFDLEKNQVTNLRIHPFCYMDANSLYEQHLKPEAAMEEMNHYHKVCKNVNGHFISIWHNHIMGNMKIYEGWKEAYFKFMEKRFV